MIRKIVNPRPVAILLAVYNGEKYLVEQLDSLVGQTNEEWTLYIRDDGSRDATPQIIQRYCRQHPGRIVAVEDGDGNLGCRDNFFRLLQTVESDYYMFCDADDVWYDFKVQVSMDRMRELEAEDPARPVLIVTDCTVCDARLRPMKESMFHQQGIYDPRPFLNEGCLGVMSFLGGARMVFNAPLKPCLFPLPAYSQQYDGYIGVRAVQHGARIEVMMRSTMKYRLHGDNVSGIRLEGKRSFLFRLKQAIADKRKAVRMRKSIGWGGYFRYFYWRAVVWYRLRGMRKQCAESEK